MFHLKFFGVTLAALVLLHSPASARMQDMPDKTIPVDPPAVARSNAGGVFSRGAPNPALLKISEIEPNVWAVVIGFATDNESAGHACMVSGRGAHADGGLLFAVRPIGDSPDAGPAAEVTVAIDGDVATVRSAAALRYCAAEGDLSGVYQREHFANPSQTSPEYDEARPADAAPAKLPPPVDK